MVSMNEFAEIAMSFENKDLPIKHVEGPQGVRGRNSDNTLIKEVISFIYIPFSLFPFISVSTNRL